MFAKRGHLQGQHGEVQLGADGGRAPAPQEEAQRRWLPLQSWSGLSSTGGKSTLLSSES